MKIVCISDTHCQLDKVAVPEGDILLHAGDLTYRGDIYEMAGELLILGKLRRRFAHVAFVCGNHDWLGERDPALLRSLAADHGLTWLQDESVTLDSTTWERAITVYGSAWTLEFCGWAFNMPRHDGTPERAWGKIPNGVDVLLTHGPAYGNLDESDDGHLGCTALSRAIEMVKPKLHVFGHIHSGYGRKVGADGVTYVNASVCTEGYKPTNAPVVVEWPVKEAVDG